MVVRGEPPTEKDGERRGWRGWLGWQRWGAERMVRMAKMGSGEDG